MTIGFGPGDSVRFFYSEGNPNNRLIHIRSIVDGEWIVFRVWSRRKRMWRYQVEHWYYFEVSREYWRIVKRGPALKD